jgi:hypothetical protein
MAWTVLHELTDHHNSLSQNMFKMHVTKLISWIFETDNAYTSCPGDWDAMYSYSRAGFFILWEEWVSEGESQQSHSPVEGEWPVVVRPLLSSKRRPQLKTRKSLERTKVWSSVPTRRLTKNDCAGEGQQQFTALDWTTSCHYTSASVLSTIVQLLFPYPHQFRTLRWCFIALQSGIKETTYTKLTRV